jgi:hypothetical protein
VTPDDLLVDPPAPGLHRTHPVANLTAVAGAVRAAYRGDGPITLGPSRRLVVLAVDGLGYQAAADILTPAWGTALTSEFPSTTMACMLTAVTGRRASDHGLIGVHQLHPDGLGAINCFDGLRDEPTSEASPRPTRTPDLPTVFADVDAPTVALPNELATLHGDVVARLFAGCDTVAPAGTTIEAAVAATPTGLLWCYVDLDSHAHRYGPDGAYLRAVADLDALAGRLSAAGTAVALFSDHGLTPHRPTAPTLFAFASAAEECRLPPGGAGRVRWLYPHSTRADRIADQLAERIPDAYVVDPDTLADWGMVEPGSIGQRRMGEIVLVAHGPDVPGPDSSAAYEHGSMTAEEMVIPFMTWPGG